MIAIDQTVLGILLFSFILAVSGLFWAVVLMGWMIARRLGWMK